MANALFVRHVHPPVIQHVAEEDDLVWVRAQGRAPVLAQIQIDDDLGEPLQGGMAARVGVHVEDLWVRDEQDVLRIDSALKMGVRYDDAQLAGDAPPGEGPANRTSRRGDRTSIIRSRIQRIPRRSSAPERRHGEPRA